MDLDALTALEPQHLNALLPAFLAGYIDDPQAAARSRARVAELVAGFGPGVLPAMLDHLATLGAEHRIYDPLPEARQICRTWSLDVLTEVHIDGADRLRRATEHGNVVLLCNHAAYFDSTAIDAALAWNGMVDIADRIVSLAGPKVYADTFRRFATSCIATLPVPQSSTFEHTEDLDRRELVRRVRASLTAAEQGLRAGRHLLIYGEGSRSRTGDFGPFLPGVARYLAFDGTIVVPVALMGTRAIMPVGRTQLTPGSLSLRIGAPFTVADQGGPRPSLEHAHALVAEMLTDEPTPA